MFAKLLPREEQYFSLFAQMTSYINDAATLIYESRSNLQVHITLSLWERARERA